MDVYWQPWLFRFDSFHVSVQSRRPGDIGYNGFVSDATTRVIICLVQAGTRLLQTRLGSPKERPPTRSQAV